jgi:thiol-disulfide isomerase/thioredoxin
MNFSNYSRLLWGVAFLATLSLTACNEGAQSAPEKTPAQTTTEQQSVNPASNPTAQPAKPLEGRAIADNVLASPIKTTEGKTIKLADYKDKVLIVNFWATWCGPCRQEIPHLIKLRQDFKDKGFEVIGVTHTSNDPDPETVNEFTKQFKIPYPIGYAESNLILGLQADGVRNNIPQSFIISRQGKVIKRFVGFGGEYPQIMRLLVQEALNEKAGA